MSDKKTMTAEEFLDNAGIIDFTITAQVDEWSGFYLSELLEEYAQNVAGGETQPKYLTDEEIEAHKAANFYPFNVTDYHHKQIHDQGMKATRDLIFEGDKQ